MVLPIFGDWEQDLPNAVRIPMYLCGLSWFFMGVAIVADVFMGAIEKVTSKKKRIFVKVTGTWRTVTVWNDTVANLTLMALGSSAPEIMLGVIEICGNEFYAGDLGPSTIVGSAAFNLFVITAVCVIAIPEGDSRTINDLGVFAVTATFSVLAYVWLFIIVATWTPEVVTIEESVITFLFFPILVIIAFAADRGYFSSLFARGEATRDHISIGDMTGEEIAEITMTIRQEHHMNIRSSTHDFSTEQMTKLVEAKVAKPKSRAHYRVGAIRHLTAGMKLTRRFTHDKIDSHKVMPVSHQTVYDGAVIKVCVAWIAERYMVMENVGTLKVAVELSVVGDMLMTDIPVAVAVQYATKDGTAEAPGDYIAAAGELVFQPGEFRKEIEVTIVDDEEYEDDEEFYIDLFEPRLLGKTPAGMEARLGAFQRVAIGILDDDNPGTLNFKSDLVNVTEESVDKEVELIVQRKGGCMGKVSVHYATENEGAISGLDFEALDDTLTFEHGQAVGVITCVIKPRGRYEREEMFRIILDNPEGGCKFDAKSDGGEDAGICTVCIQGDPAAREKLDKVASLLKINWDKAQLGHANWQQQFTAALYIGGGDEDASGTHSCMEWAMHIITVFWKVLFACIPPADFCDGWLCFWMSLFMIGVVTLFIGDLASLLGCVMNLPDAITAITFVALGTSLPDTFASKTAATQDPYADASIGNVTGSNSVNVFLGIGISWMVGAFYWAGRTGDDWMKKYPGTPAEILDLTTKYPGGGMLAVKSGDLGFSVIVFCCCAVTCIAVLMLRRRAGFGELGGPVGAKHATAVFFVFLWFVYVGMSSYQTFQTLADDPCW